MNPGLFVQHSNLEHLEMIISTFITDIELSAVCDESYDILLATTLQRSYRFYPLFTLGSLRLSHSNNVLRLTWLALGRARIQSQICWTLKLDGGLCVLDSKLLPLRIVITGIPTSLKIYLHQLGVFSERSQRPLT